MADMSFTGANDWMAHSESTWPDRNRVANFRIPPNAKGGKTEGRPRHSRL